VKVVVAPDLAQMTCTRREGYGFQQVNGEMGRRIEQIGDRESAQEGYRGCGQTWVEREEYGGSWRGE